MQPTQRRMGRPKSFNASEKQTTILALDRALDVLDALAGASGMTLSDLSTHLDQSPATMHRVLATLHARDVVEIDPRTQAWHIGSAAFRMGSAFLRRSSIVERSRPVMRELMEATGETSNLGIERNGEVMFISQVETHENIRAFFPPGTLSPMHASGIGKALLSCYSDQRIERYFQSARLNGFTDKTITRPDVLRDELARIRNRGWSFDDEEKADGMRCIAAPIRDIHGEAVAGISISGPTHRMPESAIDRIGALVADAAAQVSRGLGSS
ncbi:IclR family transcriptional regulator [Aliiroseovarius zhejiangensis]|uniref:IclR family transcriptional regulator n=1 Tax=Aliiroseovarius zhejiangensis TaxID=1632025 RepID=A0ABQ3J5T6_9RHOB|nr:HTH-type transcriptional regulator BhcR [Aliiroseovarius zhejiangensis]GHF03257.1 IclR family transcriptional regulator [Aliiroseovarius zhejiangensis]